MIKLKLLLEFTETLKEGDVLFLFFLPFYLYAPFVNPIL